MSVKCACGKSACTGKIMFLSDQLLVIENADQRESGIYLDPNGLVALLKMLQEKLRDVAGIKESL